LRSFFYGIALLLLSSNLLAGSADQKRLDFRKAWYKPELMQSSDSACDDLLRDARDKFFGQADFGAAYGIRGHGYAETGSILNWEIILGEELGQIEAHGKTVYLGYVNNPGCHGGCETNRALASDQPIPDRQHYSALIELMDDAPPAASYTYAIAQTPTNLFYLFIVGTTEEYKNKLLIYKLAPETRWRPACQISLAPINMEQIDDVDFSAAIDSLNKLKSVVNPIRGNADGAGAWAWEGTTSALLAEALYRPWALSSSPKNFSENSYGDYKRISRQLKEWSLTGLLEHKAFSLYKVQLEKTIYDISVFYQKKFQWPKVQSDWLAEMAITSAVSRGFGFYLFDPEYSQGEEDLRSAILEMRDMNEIKSIAFDVAGVDSRSAEMNTYSGAEDSILDIAIDYPEALRYLLSKGVSPNKANAFGKTPLMYAAQHNKLESVEILLKSGASVFAQTMLPEGDDYYSLDTFNMTSLHYAVRYASPALIKLLLDSGASPTIKAMSRRADFEGETPLDWLYRYTAKDFSERNPNIPDGDISEVEKWLRPPAADDVDRISKEINR